MRIILAALLLCFALPAFAQQPPPLTASEYALSLHQSLSVASDGIDRLAQIAGNELKRIDTLNAQVESLNKQIAELKAKLEEKSKNAPKEETK